MTLDGRRTAPVTLMDAQINCILLRASELYSREGWPGWRTKLEARTFLHLQREIERRARHDRAEERRRWREKLRHKERERNAAR